MKIYSWRWTFGPDSYITTLKSYLCRRPLDQRRVALLSFVEIRNENVQEGAGGVRHCNLHGRHPGSALTTADHQGSGCWNEAGQRSLSEVARGEK